MSHYTVRNLRPEDFGTLMELERRIFGTDATGTLGPYYVRLCCEFFRDDGFVVLAGGRIVGYLLSFERRGEAYCTTLAVTPEVQGSRALVRLLAAYVAAVEPRVDTCWFTVEEGNESARALHRILGAREVELRRDFYGAGDHRIVSRIDRGDFERVRRRLARLGVTDEAAPPASAEPRRAAV